MIRFRFPIGTEIFLMSNVSRLNEADKSPVLMRNGGWGGGGRDRVIKLNTYIHLVLKLRKRGAITSVNSVPNYDGQAYLYTFCNYDSSSDVCRYNLWA
jgi:hypothetical protein